MLLLVTMKSTAWPDSFAGPVLIAVAWPVKLWAPASSATDRLVPTVKDGTSFTGLITSDAVSVPELKDVVPPFGVALMPLVPLPVPLV